MRRYRQHTNQAHTFAASKSKSMAAIYGPVQEAHDLVGICLQLLSCAGRAAHLSIHSRQHRTKGSNVVHRKQEPLARAWLQVGRYSLQYLGVCLQQPQEHRSCGILLLEPEWLLGLCCLKNVRQAGMISFITLQQRTPNYLLWACHSPEEPALRWACCALKQPTPAWERSRCVHLCTWILFMRVWNSFLKQVLFFFVFILLFLIPRSFCCPWKLFLF